MIVADSSVWIANIRNDDTPQVRMLRELDASDLLIGDLVVLEVLRGVRSEREAAREQSLFETLGITPIGGPDRVVSAARHYRRLRTLGFTIRSIVDLVIATYCIEGAHMLLHQDRDFDPFERYLGLQVYRP